MQSPDGRFGDQYGYVPAIVEAVQAALKKAELPIAKLEKAIQSAGFFRMKANTSASDFGSGSGSFHSLRAAPTG